MFPLPQTIQIDINLTTPVEQFSEIILLFLAKAINFTNQFVQYAKTYMEEKDTSLCHLNLHWNFTTANFKLHLNDMN
jgi:hypothetical protein